MTIDAAQVSPPRPPPRLRRRSYLLLVATCVVFITAASSLWVSSKNLLLNNDTKASSRTKVIKTRYSSRNDNSTSVIPEDAKKNLQSAAAASEKSDDDGCFSLPTDKNAVEPQWVNYTKSDHDFYERTKRCNRAINKGEHFVQRAFKKLSCSSSSQNESALDNFQDIIASYRRIWFIGDSVLQQVYLSLLCMLDPAFADSKHIFQEHRKVDRVRSKLQFRVATFPRTDFVSLGTNFSNTSFHVDQDMFPYSSVHPRNKTWLLYSWFGRLNGGDLPLFQGDFKRAIEASTKDDAIIVDAGHHYHPPTARKLRTVSSFISTMSASTNASVFFLETGTEEWETSNGQFARKFMWRTNCSVLTPTRMAGLGTPSPGAVESVSQAVKNFASLAVPPTSYDDFGGLFPHMFDQNRTLLARYHNTSCIPSCLPADYKSRMSLPLLQSNQSKVHIVPIFNQLVAKKQLNALLPLGDCTHKSLDTLIEMNRQIFRTILRSQTSSPLHI